jgi:hypothetical protein
VMTTAIHHVAMSTAMTSSGARISLSLCIGRMGSV